MSCGLASFQHQQVPSRDVQVHSGGAFVATGSLHPLPRSSRFHHHRDAHETIGTEDPNSNPDPPWPKHADSQFDGPHDGNELSND